MSKKAIISPLLFFIALFIQIINLLEVAKIIEDFFQNLRKFEKRLKKNLKILPFRAYDPSSCLLAKAARKPSQLHSVFLGRGMLARLFRFEYPNL